MIHLGHDEGTSRRKSWEAVFLGMWRHGCLDWNKMIVLDVNVCGFIINYVKHNFLRRAK